MAPSAEDDPQTAPLSRLDRLALIRSLAASPNASDLSRELYGEVAARMAEHLDPIRLTPHRILDIGTGPGVWADALAQRFPLADIITGDLVRQRLPRSPRSGWSTGLAEVARRLPGPLARRRGARLGVCMDGASAIQPGSMDVVTSSLAMHWIDDVPGLLRDVAHALTPDGLFIFATLGADTLEELRRAWATHDPTHVHVHPFPDMHDIGDQLSRAGFRDVVMDAERVTLTYESARRLLAELRNLDGGNVAHERLRGLLSPRQLAAMYDTYLDLARDPNADADAPNRVRATVELVFAHAWAPAPSRGSVSVAAPTL